MFAQKAPMNVKDDTLGSENNWDRATWKIAVDPRPNLHIISVWISAKTE